MELKDMSMGVSLEPEHHVYTCGRVVIPSVSEIIRPASAIHYGEINKKRMTEAAKRGSAVHRAIEDEKEFGFSINHGEYVEAYKSWVAEQTEYRQIASEQIITHKAMIYAGTVDEICWLNSRLTIIDFKTSAQRADKLWALQLTGYRMAYLSHHTSYLFSNPSIRVLWLHDQKAELITLEPNDQMFLACMKLHTYMKEETK